MMQVGGVYLTSNQQQGMHTLAKVLRYQWEVDRDAFQSIVVRGRCDSPSPSFLDT